MAGFLGVAKHSKPLTNEFSVFYKVNCQLFRDLIRCADSAYASQLRSISGRYLLPLQGEIMCKLATVCMYNASDWGRRLEGSIMQAVQTTSTKTATETLGER